METDLVGLQRILDYLKFREIASKSKASQKQIDELANEYKESWWSKNKSRFCWRLFGITWLQLEEKDKSRAENAIPIRSKGGF